MSKTMSINAAEQQDDLEEIIKLNMNYLADKVKVSQVVKPSPYYRKLPGKMAYSEYNRNFIKSSINFQQSDFNADVMKYTLKQSDPVKMSMVGGYQTNYRQQYQYGPNPQHIIFKKNQKHYQKSQIPCSYSTSYGNRFLRWNVPPPQSLKRKEHTVSIGCKLSANTSYGKHYPKKMTILPKPIRHSKYHSTLYSHKIFMNYDSKQGYNTSYNKSFCSAMKKQEQMKSCRPNEKYSKSNIKMKYKTEYGQEYEEKKKQLERDKSLLNIEEIKKYCLGGK